MKRVEPEYIEQDLGEPDYSFCMFLPVFLNIKKKKKVLCFLKYNSPLLSIGDTFPDPQGMPETVDHTKTYIYYDFLIHTYL